MRLVLLFIALGFLAANLLVWVLQYNYTAQQTLALHESSEQYVQQLQPLTNQSLAIGGMKTLALSDASVKEQAKNAAVDNEPAAMAKLAIIQHLFDAAGVYIISASGRILAHQSKEKSAVGNQVAWRPYFQQAIKGIANVYPAIGTTAAIPGLYFAVPIYENTAPNTPPIGVLVMKKAITEVANMLNRFNGKAFLMSPQGVVFASSHNEYLYHVLPPLSPEMTAAIRQQKQFGKLFDDEKTSIPTLPFEWREGQALVEWDNRHYISASASVDWSDPLGEWRLLLLSSNERTFTQFEYLMIYAGLPLLFAFLGWWVHWQLQQLRQHRQDQRRLAMMGIALEHSPLGVIMTDDKNIIQWVNPAFKKMTGYSEQTLLGNSPSLLNSIKTPKTTFEELSASLAAKQSWRGEFVNRREDGSHFWSDTTISPAYNQRTGALMGYVSMNADTTEQRHTLLQLEEQLTLTEASTRFLTAIKSGQDPQSLAAHALEEIMLFLSAPYCAIYATLPTNPLAVLACLGSQSEHKVLNDEKKQLINDLMLKSMSFTISPVPNAEPMLLGGKELALDSIMLMPFGDGKSSCGLLEIGLLSPLTQDKKAYLTNVIREFSAALRLSLDMLVRQQIEARAIEAESRTRLLIEAVDDGLLGLDKEGTITFANPSVANMLECESAQGLIGKSAAEVVFAYNEQAMRDTGVMTALNYGEKHHAEYTLNTQQGNTFIAEITSLPIKNSQGWDGIVLVIRDVSERKVALQQLQEQMDELTRFTDVALGRELKMIELKQQVNSLLVASGQEEQYVIAE